MLQWVKKKDLGRLKTQKGGLGTNQSKKKKKRKKGARQIENPKGQSRQKLEQRKKKELAKLKTQKGGIDKNQSKKRKEKKKKGSLD